MPGFVPQKPISNSIGMERDNNRSSQNSEFGTVKQSLGFHRAEATNGRNTVSKPSTSSSQSLTSFGTNLSASIAGSHRSQLRKELHLNVGSISGSYHENGRDLNIVDVSPHTDTSTDISADDKHLDSAQTNSHALMVFDSSDRSKDKVLEQKAYVQQLESSRLKLTQLEQELQRAHQQGIFISNSGDQPHATGGNGALAFDAEYSRWVEQQSRHINELRATVNAHASDIELRTTVDNVTTHYEAIFRLKGNVAKADIFHILSGTWKTSAERCFMWIGDFRTSDILKLLANQLESLTEQQLVGIHNLQQTSQQAEDALSQGMEALQQSLAETLANGTPAPSGPLGNVANYMGQMAMAMGKLGTLEGFVRQEPSRH